MGGLDRIELDRIALWRDDVILVISTYAACLLLRRSAVALSK